MFKIISTSSKLNEAIDSSIASQCPISKGQTIGIENHDDVLQWFFDIYKSKSPELFQYCIHYVEYSSNVHKMESEGDFWHFAYCYINSDKFFKSEEEAKSTAKQYLSNREKREDSVEEYKFSIRRYKVMTVKEFVQQVLLNRNYRQAFKCTTLADITTAKD